MTDKRPVGCPKITTNDFPENWNAIITDLGLKGGSDFEIRARLGGICHETWTRLLKEDDEFSETVTRARVLCRAYWDRIGREELWNKDFQYNGWRFNYDNRFIKHNQEVEKFEKPLISTEPLDAEAWEQQYGKTE